MTTTAEEVAEEVPETTHTSSPVALVAIVFGALAALAGVGLLVAGMQSEAPNGTPRTGPEYPLTAMNLGVREANNSPMLLADPSEERFVVAANRLDAPDFSCALQVSGDGGRNWAPANPVSQLPAGAEKCYGPEVAFDREGRLYYLFVGLAGGGNEPVGVFISTSDDRARTFSAPRRVLGPLNFGVRMAIDPDLGTRGRLHLVWLKATSDPGIGAFGPPPNPIMSAYSDDGAKTFSKPVQVSDPARQRVVAPALALGPDHAVHVAYYDIGDDARDYQALEGPVWEGTWSVVVATSTDRGRRFGPGVVVEDGVVPFERVMLIFTMAPPSLAADGDGRLCAAWGDAQRGDPDAMVACSADRGRSWDKPRRLNDDPAGSGARQYLPRLAFSPDGRLDAIFLDRRADPTGARNDVAYTYSRDGGKSFSRNLRITQDPSDSRIGQQYVGAAAQGQFEIGARLGLLSTRSGALAAWPDTRNSDPSTPAQDLFLTPVDLPVGKDRKPLQAGGAVLLGLGLMSLGAGISGRRRRARSSRQAVRIDP